MPGGGIQLARKKQILILEFKEVEVRPPQPVVRVVAVKIPRRPPKYTPPPTHPWKRIPFTQLPG